MTCHTPPPPHTHTHTHTQTHTLHVNLFGYIEKRYINAISVYFECIMCIMSVYFGSSGLLFSG